MRGYYTGGRRLHVTVYEGAAPLRGDFRMKLGVLRRSLLGARIGTIVQVRHLEDYLYEIVIPGIGVCTLLSKNALPRYVEILE